MGSRRAACLTDRPPWHHTRPALRLACTALPQHMHTLHLSECSLSAVSSSQALESSLMQIDELDAAVKRLFLTRMRLGEFERQPLPFFEVNASAIGCSAHLDTVRQMAAASIVMAANKDGVLPRPLPSKGEKIAIVGPFADCGSCYLHSYAAPWPGSDPSGGVSYLKAFQQIVNQTGATLLTDTEKW